MTVRREFLVVLAGGALAVPLALLAQQPARVRRIGFLWDVDLPSFLLDAFRAGLRELGYIEGRDYVIEQRSAKGDIRLLPSLAAELLALKVDLIVAPGLRSALEARAATRDVPIVITEIPDPVAVGLAASLRRPGGNVTGLTSLNDDLAIKHLDLLRQITPNLRRVGFLYYEDSVTHDALFTKLEGAGSKLQIQCIRARVREERDIAGAFAALQRDKAEGLIVAPSNTLATWRSTIIDHAARHGLPAIYNVSTAADAGGLISYSSNAPQRFKRAAVYVDKILKGARPGDLPIEQPTKFELAVNMKTARALGITIPQSILVRADRVIE